MPTYRYACTECGHAFDAVQSFSDDSLTECPVCGGRLRKRYDSIGVTFHGPGFYRTDSRPAPSSSDSGSSAATTSSTTAPTPSPSTTSSTSD